MAFVRTIGVKIFGIALLLLVIMAAVAFWSTTKVQTVNREVFTIARGLLPLADQVAVANTEALHQRLHLEALFALYRVPARDTASISGEQQQYDAHGLRVAAAIEAARALADQGLALAVMEANRLEFARLQPLLVEMENEHKRLQMQSKTALAAMGDDKPEVAAAVANLVVAEQQNFEEAMRGVLAQVRGYTEQEADTAGEHERQAVQANVVLTIVASVIGLCMAFLVTRGLVRPVQRLLTGARAVEEGRLDTEVPVTSTDEIGMLTRAFNVMVHGLRAKERIKETFGQYVDPRVVAGLIDGQGASAGSKQVVTVFFSDIEGFTSIAERLTPASLVTLINAYFTLMSAAIRKQSGLIDKYIGDAVMAFWGAPFTPAGEQAERGCLAALEQFAALEEFRGRLPELMGVRKGLPTINIRIGLATGEAIVGSVGSDSAKSYTVMGDTVNLGSRLEGANKVYGTRIMVCQQTRDMAGDSLEFRELDALTVVGKSEPIRVFELLGRAGQVAADLLQVRDRFEAGLAAYRRRDWEAADAAFAECLALRPEDPPSILFRQRVSELRAGSPRADWDGVWHLAKK